MSSRGTGSTTKKEEVVDGKKITIEEVNPDFRLLSPGDFVLSPSVPDAGTLRMIESRMNDGAVTLAELESFGLEPLEPTKEEILKRRYESAVRLAGYKGNFASYKKLFEKG
jgi:hypothetical protein